MATQVKQWFFNTPQTSSYKRLAQNNKPDQQLYQDLLDSVAMKLEVGDTASLTQQGLVKIVSDANAKTRTSASSGTMTTVVTPHHLPMLIATGTTEVTLALHPTGTSPNGLKITPVSITSGSNTRLSYKIELDPTTLTAVTPVAGDYVVIEDLTDNLPKKVLVSSLQTLFSTANYFSRTGTIVYPTTSGDKLRLDGNFYFDGTADRSIYQDVDPSDIGHNLKIYAGSGAAGFIGGNLYLHGGIGIGATDGNVGICYNGTTAYGGVGIGGPDDATTYRAKIYGNVHITGYLTVGTPSATVPTTIICADANNKFMTKTPKLMMDLVVGSTLAARAIPYFDGAAWTSLTTGATTDKYLMINGSGNLAFDDLVLTNKVTNASIATGALISFAKMALLNASIVPVTTAGGLITSSVVTAIELGYSSGLTANIQTQITNALSKSSGNAGAYKTTDFACDGDNKSHYIMNITGNNVTATLPELANVEVGHTISFTKKFTGGAFAAAVDVHGGTGDQIFSDSFGPVGSHTIAGTTGSSVVMIKRDASYWDVIMTNVNP